jgi:hypothetical protein
MEVRIKRASVAALMAAVAAAAPMAAQDRGVSGLVRRAWIGSPTEEYARLMQLTGVAGWSSRMIRPTEARLMWTAPESASWRSPWAKRYASASSDTILPGLMPLRFFAPYTQLTNNTAFAYGMNDGVMWAGRGVSYAQTMGAAVSLGPLAIDIAPTFTRSENRAFDLAPFRILQINPVPWADQYAGLGIDMPQRFGDAPVETLHPGQSAVTVAFGNARVGMSARNLWWGPGTQNALIMTNNAPGFPHVFMKTGGPMSVGIGKLEAQWILGRLRQSEFWRSAKDTMPRDRWLHGATLTFEPKGAPGMYFGLTRVFMQYEREYPIGINELRNVFQTPEKNDLVTPDAPFGDDRREQMFSLSFRWVGRDGFEVYGEWGRNDHSTDFRDYFIEPDHSRAWVMGAARAFRVGEGALVVRMEGTDLTNTLSNLGRATPVWYAHPKLPQGWTQAGQVIGAGIGPGSNHQTLTVDWFHPRGRLGMITQRHLHNIDGFFKSSHRDPYEHDVSWVIGPRVSLFAGPVDLDVMYQLQYEFNRGAILLRDVRNYRVEVRATLNPQ